MAGEEHAQLIISADTAGVARALDTVALKVDDLGRIADKSGRTLTKSLGKSAGGALKSMAGGLTALAGIGAVGTFAAIGSEAFDFEEQLLRAGIQARMTTEQMDAIRSALNKTSREFGISRGEIQKASASVVDLLGGSALTEGLIQEMGRAMFTTGADAGDLANTIFALNKTFGVTEAELGNVLSGIVSIGEEGSVPFAELARSFRKLGSQAVEFMGQGQAGAARLAATVNTALAGFGSTDEAATGISNLLTAFQSKSKELKKLGVKIYDKKDGKLQKRSFDDIIEQFAKSKAVLTGNDTRLIAALGSKEALVTLKALINGQDEYNKFIEEGANKKRLSQIEDQLQQSAVIRQKKAINELKQTLLETFTPGRIEKFVAAMEKVLFAVVKVVEGIEAIGKVLTSVDPVEAMKATEQRIQDASATGIEINPWTGQAAVRDSQGNMRVLSADEERQEVAFRRAQAEFRELTPEQQQARTMAAQQSLMGFAQQAGQTVRQDPALARLIAVLERRERPSGAAVDVRVNVTGEGTAAAAVRNARNE